MGGHSLWFRLFFATFLPVKTDHPCTKKKMVNGIPGPTPTFKAAVSPSHHCQSLLRTTATACALSAPMAHARACAQQRVCDR